jgi:hypothetical protein
VIRFASLVVGGDVEDGDFEGLRRQVGRAQVRLREALGEEDGQASWSSRMSATSVTCAMAAATAGWPWG